MAKGPLVVDIARTLHLACQPTNNKRGYLENFV